MKFETERLILRPWEESRKENLLVYIHGKGGNAKESEHYRNLFPNCEVYGFDYKAETPWEAKVEFVQEFEKLRKSYKEIILIANSIGACFSMHAGLDKYVKKAYFISPMANLESLITNMILWAGVTEAVLEEKGIIPTNFGEDLSWEYLQYLRKNPISWNTPTEILYGTLDNLQTIDVIKEFAEKNHCGLTVMEGGEHWFHTEEQMAFLDNWIKSK